LRSVVIKDPQPLSLSWLYPIRDLTGFLVWCASFFGSEIVYRANGLHIRSIFFHHLKSNRPVLSFLLVGSQVPKSGYQNLKLHQESTRERNTLCGFEDVSTFFGMVEAK
jgi:hypothetical protein